MKKILALLFVTHGLLFGQIENPASWNITTSKSKVVVGEEIEIILTAKIDKGWYMYSYGKFEMAPSAIFTFQENSGFKLIGPIRPIHDKKKVDEYIGEYRYFTEVAEFRQKIKITGTNIIIKGTYEYSTCSVESGVCLPPKEEDFTINNLTVSEKKVEAPNSKVDKLAETANKDSSTQKKESSVLKDSSVVSEKVEISKVIATPNEPQEGLFAFFLLAFLSGLVALFTPCVFPMIPMTVTFFLKSSKSKSQGVVKALFYGVSIILIYTIIGTLVSKFVGPEAANFLSTHWLPNLFFFLTFIIFAFSFLGMFEITLPSSFVNAADKQSDRGGYIGIFFMATTLVLVSFSCTGPIVGTILVESAGGATLKPMIGMFGFSLAFAIPFTIFATFPSLLKGLPKSGGWLNSIKVVLGFLELALAFKFLSLADQAYHWRILDRQVNIAIWIAIFTMLGLYLIHKIKTAHDDEDYATQPVKVPKLLLAITSFAFVIYLIPGMFGAPLKALSGYLPPVKTNEFDIGASVGLSSSSTVSYLDGCEKPLYSEFLSLPHGLQGYFDYQQALACAKKLHKPIFIDFTGHGCVNCREVEANVWSDPTVLTKLKSDFIMLALYVDDKTELPEKQWYTSTYDGKVKSSVGKQNADLQIVRYKTNAQPFYVVIDENEQLISGPITYTQSVEEFLNFLHKGSSPLLYH